jgi:hypothetical protein
MDGMWLAPLAPFLMIVGIVWVKSQARLEEKRIAAGVADRGKSDRSRPDRSPSCRKGCRCSSGS